MTLTVGARFGSYEVRSALGVGGMGEVYRARDTRLERDVAIKVLPETFTSDCAVPAGSEGPRVAQPSEHRGHL